jgi:very-short-patch-repair endonuclease
MTPMYRDQQQRDFARNLRNEATSPERQLWHFLRAQKLRGHKFRRQAAVGSYIIDFVCFELKLAVELDGPQHLESDTVKYDSRRTQWLNSRGYQVLRFRNQEIDENIRAVVGSIERAIIELEARAHPPPQPSPPRGGSRKTLMAWLSRNVPFRGSQREEARVRWWLTCSPRWPKIAATITSRIC